ncbi:formate dehydrogenase subunit gamma [Geminicoccus harenae]|uniref:formate dehydrogenase subunit gamma n=1 Tax=Geminicoccus harenae TaxID=2498453 RepID=UPI001C955E15|nr:formate dehydrogenase subunit gamma [Geminicoccus harenae]
MTHGLNRIRALVVMIALAVACLPAMTGPAGAQEAGAQAVNPTAMSVQADDLLQQEGKLQGYLAQPDPKLAVLEQPQGRQWRVFHESWLPWGAGILILAVVLLLGGVYLVKGPIQADEVSGIKILRFNVFERFTHWLTAVSFIILALSGINYIFGKRYLMPLIGPDAFGTLSQWGKYAHNYLAWPFMLGVLFMIVVWVKDNFPKRGVDWAWLKAGGGVFNNTHPSAGRFNAGQKLIFWWVALAGIVMSVTGIMLLFPFAAFGVNGMQITQVVHSVVGFLFIAVIIFHIYIGTLGMEGAYDAMGSGEVDVAWARAHHDLWVEEQLRR